MSIEAFRLQIQEQILAALRHCIDTDFVLLDVPHYGNVGDVMIWKATTDILRQIGHRCLYSCSIETYNRKRVPQGALLLFMGGGNFGDLWERHQLFRHQVMTDFPDNPIVQLPQSVWFEVAEHLTNDVNRFRHHRAPVTIFLRDMQSKNIIENNYPTIRACLLPDMALSLNVLPFLRKCTESQGRLWVNRQDKERPVVGDLQKVPNDVVSADWPSMSGSLPAQQRLVHLSQWLQRRGLGRWNPAFTNLYYQYILRHSIIQSGVDFISPYKEVYTSRLHAAVLAALMGKRVYMIDNNYGKCRGVYELWMSDLTNVSLL